MEIKLKASHKSISSISSNNHFNYSDNQIRLSDIHMLHNIRGSIKSFIDILENKLNHSNESKNSEENEGGEQIFMKKFNNVSYNPNYSVFNKDERPYTLSSNVSSENGLTTSDTKYFNDNIDSESDQAKEFRKQNMVPRK